MSSVTLGPRAALTVVASYLRQSDFDRSFRPRSLTELELFAHAGGAPMTAAQRTRLAAADLDGNGTIGNTTAERRAAWSAIDSFDRDGDRRTVSSRHGTGFALARALAPGVRTHREPTAAVSTGEVTMSTDAPNIGRERVVPDGGRWDGARVLDRLGQYEGGAVTGSQAHRCGAATELSGAILRGPEATARFADGLGERDIAARVRGGTATYGDLSTLQDRAYTRFNGDTNPSLSTTELGALSRATGVSREGARTVATNAEVDRRIAALGPNESFTMLLSRSSSDPGSEVGGHYVRVGRDAAGRAFVYDPGSMGEHHLTYQDTDPARFARYVHERSYHDDGRQLVITG